MTSFPPPYLLRRLDTQIECNSSTNAYSESQQNTIQDRTTVTALWQELI